VSSTFSVDYILQLPLEKQDGDYISIVQSRLRFLKTLAPSFSILHSYENLIPYGFAAFSVTMDALDFQKLNGSSDYVLESIQEYIVSNSHILHSEEYTVEMERKYTTRKKNAVHLDCDGYCTLTYRSVDELHELPTAPFARSIVCHDRM
jgi:hypothetical protein